MSDNYKILYEALKATCVDQNEYNELKLYSQEQDKKFKESLKHLELALKFTPKGLVIPNLSPMFYFTLNYNDDVILQSNIDLAINFLNENKK